MTGTDPCPWDAVVNTSRYPCRRPQGHEGVHHFAWPVPSPCMAPFCRLPDGHRELHDIPAGRAEFAPHIPPAEIASPTGKQES